MLGGEERVQVAQRLLSFVDGRAKTCDVLLGFCDGAAKRVNFSDHKGKELTAETLNASASRFAYQGAAGGGDDFVDCGEQKWPIPLQPAMIQYFFGAKFIDFTNWPLEPIFQNATSKIFGSLEFLRRVFVGLVENDEKILSLGRDALDQIELRAGDRRIGPENNDGGINVWKEFFCRNGVTRKNGAESWSIDQAKPRGEAWIWRKHFDGNDAFAIFGIGFLGNVISDRSWIDLRPAGVFQPDARASRCGVTNDGRNRSYGSDAGGQQALAKKCIQQRRFAAFELADASEVKSVFLKARREVGCIMRYRG